MGVGVNFLNEDSPGHDRGGGGGWTAGLAKQGLLDAQTGLVLSIKKARSSRD